MLSKSTGDTKPAQPKKFVAFSPEDSQAIETAYQGKLQELEGERIQIKGNNSPRVGSKRPRATSTDGAQEADSAVSNTTVPVNEDFLFDVTIEDRELAPIYWEGPIYDVRRGSWFYQEGSALRPCEENLAAQLEEGYLKIKPWQYPPKPPPRARSNSAPKTVVSKSSVENLKAAAQATEDSFKKGPPAPQHQPQTHRLFGGYMNSVVTYQDSTTAWLSSDGMLSWVTSTVYERISGSGYMSGVKLVRGYTEPKKSKEEKRPATPTGTKSASKEQDDKLSKALKRRSAPPPITGSEVEDPKPGIPDGLESTRSRLTRQLSNLIETAEDPEAREEAIREREEEEISGDYNARVDDNQGREIEHLVLVTHGIGQLLSRRYGPSTTSHAPILHNPPLTGPQNGEHQFRARRQRPPQVNEVGLRCLCRSSRAQLGDWQARDGKLPSTGVACGLAPSARLSQTQAEKRRAGPRRRIGGGIRLYGPFL